MTNFTPIRIIIGSLLTAAIIFLGIAILIGNGNLNLSGIGGPSSATFNRFTTASSSYLFIGAGVANKILATTTDRAYVSIYNESPNTVYLNINQGSTASTTYGLILEANKVYEFIPGKNLYDGTVYASSSAATKLHILEVTTDD